MSDRARVILDLISSGLFGKLFADLTPEERADLRALTAMREEADTNGDQDDEEAGL
ncbi:MAG: gluconate 2-dehydrogenase subunit 3 family protein [Oscillospiraceae bacterium]|nr:gluconate 2-dehydrogenase subunit 3 family protein [Oscillospiraceae bacterium]